MSPHALALRPEPRAFAALCLTRRTVQPDCMCPVSSRAHPPRGDCTADQGPPRLRATPGPSTGDPEADRQHLTAAGPPLAPPGHPRCRRLPGRTTQLSPP
ncbi:hypothetical protein NDU88_000241 [Pleurodeles waltl]|uniref:Uncharacterized protein n=1 Tax=Pleurodeles waltl TaxID=8319 RepID=A0AAV7P0H5_PLEWA|nr:hypothetical protein NDU88_000241 [Pleurodeles waltl]